MTIDNVKLEFSESGKIVRITSDNGRIILEALVHGPLKKVAENCTSNNSIVPGRANMFRGELYGLAGYELLDTENERVIEK